MQFSIGRYRIGFGTLGAVAGLGVAGLVLLFNLFLSHMLVRTLPPILTGACLLYLVARRNPTPAVGTLPTWAVHALPSVVFLGTAALIALSLATGGRGPTFYLLTIALSVVVFVQIAFTPDEQFSVGMGLAQVLALGFVVRFAGLLGSAGYVGVDVWIHMPQYVEGILSAGSIQGMGPTKYALAPLYHLSVASTSLLADLPPRLALFGSIGIAMGLTGLFVYLTAARFVDPRWAVFAAAAYSISDFVVVWSIHLIPTSLGVVFFLAVLLVFVRIQQRGTRPAVLVLIVAFVLAMALTHQVASFIMLVLLGAGSLAQIALNMGQLRDRLFADSSPSIRVHSVHGYSAFAVGLLMLIWSVTPWGNRTFVEAVLVILWGSIEGSAGLFNRGETTNAVAAGGDQTLLGQTVIPLIDQVGFSMLLFGTVVGSLYILQRERASQSGLALIIAAVIMLFFTLVPPLFGLRNFLPGRWFAFLYAVLAILAAVGFDRLRRDCSPQLFAAVALVFALVFSGGMVLTSDATQDAPAFPEENVRYAYTPAEMSAMETIVEHTDSDATDPIYSDSPYISALNRYGGEERFSSATVDDGPPDHEVTLYRDYQRDGAPRFETEEGADHIQRTTIDEMCGTRTIGYDNSDVTLCER
ncbi:glycosyltransferase family 39 protein [Halalkalicoccus subterraneus]|uniref:glycosyltransferase family 39 protein n=1 Tax=Halalkalicoccus subterraneus TaxID=2675002 RepID=UPI000EFB7377|nr:glycosyltransferase family 39 protein [Halalkalicoccus subterraneus]